MKLKSTRLRVRLRLLKYFIFKVYSFRYNFASEEYSTTAMYDSDGVKMSRDHAVSDCDRPLISIKRSEKFNLQMSSNKEFSGFIVHFLHQTFITPLRTHVNIFDFWNTDTLYDWLDDDLYLLAAVLHVLLLPVVVREQRLARLGQQEEHHEPCGQQTAADKRRLLETWQSDRVQGVGRSRGMCFKATF